VPVCLCRDIDMEHDYFQFRIWDRNNYTTRQSDWLMRHRPGIHMVYRLHEVLVYPKEQTTTKEIPWEVSAVGHSGGGGGTSRDGSTIPATRLRCIVSSVTFWLLRHYGHQVPSVLCLGIRLRCPENAERHCRLTRGPRRGVCVAWQVYEVETATSWHVKIGHQHSQSYKRYLFDLSLLEKDLRDEGDRPSDHTLYYLGITHFALIEAGIPLMTTEAEKAAFVEEVNERVEKGLFFLSERICLHRDSPNWEQTWASMRWLAYSYQVRVRSRQMTSAPVIPNQLPHRSRGRPLPHPLTPFRLD
jgi:hypothetical protein